MRRVAVVGSPGVGKSTFARELSRRTGIPVVHLDNYFWKPNWVETPLEEWRTLQATLLSGQSWIVDGDHGATFDVRFARADTIVVLRLSRFRCILAALGRSLRYRGQALQAVGCPEHLDLQFLLWIWRYPNDTRLARALEQHKAHLQVVELDSRREVNAYLRGITGAGP